MVTPTRAELLSSTSFQVVKKHYELKTRATEQSRTGKAEKWQCFNRLDSKKQIGGKTKAILVSKVGLRALSKTFHDNTLCSGDDLLIV